MAPKNESSSKLSWFERVVKEEEEEEQANVTPTPRQPPQKSLPYDIQNPDIQRMSISPLQIEASSSSKPIAPYVVNTIQEMPYNVLYKYKTSQPLSKKKPNIKPEYIIKPYSQIICTLETSSPQYDLFQTIQDYFGKGWLYKPWNLNKTPTFYQSILILTGSATIKHNYYQNDQTIPAYSQCKIHKVISPYDWFGPLSEQYAFPDTYKYEPFYKTTFNYWEYQQAWFNAFYIQNANNQHTWLMYFDHKQQVDISKFPSWWCQWWECFGNIPEIQKPPILESFNIFKSKFKPTDCEKRFNAFAHFSTNFYLPWIVNWFLEVEGKLVPIVRRKYQVRWWDKYNIHEDLQPRNVELWIQDQMETRNLPNSRIQDIQPSMQITRLDEKQKFAALLAASLNDPELQQLLAQHTANSTKSSVHSSASTNNDDDDPDYLI